MWQSSYDEKKTLYIIPTPIGNIGDMTFRALDILKNCEVIFSEDTRVTSKLLSFYSIEKKLISLHEFNEIEVKEKVLSYLERDFNVGLVTDQGTPIISDPGYRTVKYVSSLGYNVVTLPGACAFVPAIANSAISCNHFLFYGFLDSKSSKRKKELEKLVSFPYPLVFYEAPHRILDVLNDFLLIFGNRKISISREISKKFESVYRGDLVTLISNPGNIKGEYVIVLEGQDEIFSFDLTVNEHIKLYIDDGYSTMEAIKKVANERNVPKNVIYKEYHQGGNK